MTAATGQRLARGPSAASREAGAALLLLEDVRTAMLLLNAVRYRALKRWLGLDTTGANLLTLVALATIADAAQRQTARLVAPGAPGASDFALSVAVGETALRTVAGQAASGAAPASVLFTIAVAYKLLGTPSRRALRAAARSPWRLRRAVMSQAQRLSDAAAATAARARDAVDTATGSSDPTTPPQG